MTAPEPLGRTPAASFLMPVFNAERYLREAVESVLAQTLPDLELIAVDDGSTDRSLDVLRAAARRDPRVRVVSRPNTGLSVALNEALDLSRAPLVARMDADDVALPDRLARQVRYMASHPDCVAVGGRVTWVDPRGRPIRDYPDVLTHEQIDAFHLTERHSALIHPAVTMRRGALTVVGRYRAEFEPAEDLDLWLRLAEVGRVANLPDVVLRYRLHDASVSRRRAAEQARMCEAVVAGARRRRGLAPDPRPARADPPPDARAERLARRAWWASEARRAGRYRTANAICAEVLREHPRDPAAWRLAASAGLGPVSAAAAWAASAARRILPGFRR